MSSSRIPLLFRAMHTGGRRVPHPPLGGAGGSGPGGMNTPPPQKVEAHPPPPSPTSPHIDANAGPHGGNVPESATHEAAHSHPSSSEFLPPAPPVRSDGQPWIYPPRHFGRNQKELKFRPRRSIPVPLPGGYPEPPSYPPPKEYFDEIRDPEFVKQAPHPLWQFFHVNHTSTAPPDERAQMPAEVGAIEGFVQEDLDALRSWSAGELRYRTFAELHTLWYNLLKERNVLLTQRDERRRMRIRVEGRAGGISGRLNMVRKSMGCIKQILQERRLGLQAALLGEVEQPADSLPPFPWSDPLNSYAALTKQARFRDVRVPRALRGAKKIKKMPPGWRADQTAVDGETPGADDEAVKENEQEDIERENNAQESGPDKLKIA